MLGAFPRAVRAGSLVAAVFALALGGAAAASASTLYVSPKGKPRAACTKRGPCRTIGVAVARARRGDTVRVAKGTYRAQVTVSKDITLAGARGAVIDAAGHGNGILITGPGGDGATVTGFVIEHATFEGILAMRASRLTIADNTVKDNDLGGAAKHPKGECAPQGPIPGDCGEGLHLMSVTSSQLTGNLVEDNAGGILLTDELGPTAFNTIEGNRSLNNVLDCGITLASHSTRAVLDGSPAPSAAGVYDNYVVDNTANGDGTKGNGAGILMAAPGPGTATYNNIVTGNTAQGDGQAGITVHSHAPGQYVDGNVIVGNTLSDDGLSGDPDFGVTHTVGILAASAVSKLSGTVIAGNRISDVYYGIWTKNVPTISPSSNTFTNVTNPLTQS
jgi:nitrous oxidase accessory protein NosD